MYTVSIYSRNKEYRPQFGSEREAKNYARVFWHLEPRIYDPAGNLVLTDEGICTDSEY